jgi:hypothetical protein
MALAFWAVYLTGLVCLYAELSYIVGLKVTLLLFWPIHVSFFLFLVVLCSAGSNGNADSHRAKWSSSPDRLSSPFPPSVPFLHLPLCLTHCPLVFLVFIGVAAVFLKKHTLRPI